MKKTLIVGVVLGAALVAFYSFPRSAGQTSGQPTQQGAKLADVVVPETMTVNAEIGKGVFDAKCASCHGANAEGQDGKAPPLIHKIYEPSHHGDEAFQRAAALGVQQHHWRFGNMPAVEGLTRGDITMIVAYIREVQQANGIN